MLVSNEAVHNDAPEEDDLDEDDPFFDHLELQGEVEALEQARDVIAAQLGIENLEDLDDYYSDDEDESNIEEMKTEDSMQSRLRRR